MKLALLTGRFAVCKVGPQEAGPEPASSRSLHSVTRAGDETTVVCEEGAVAGGMLCETGWRAIKVDEVLDFSATGVLSSLAGPLAEAGISIFAVSTFSTDYLLIKDNELSRALACLVEAGFTIDDR